MNCPVCRQPRTTQVCPVCNHVYLQDVNDPTGYPTSAQQPKFWTFERVTHEADALLPLIPIHEPFIGAEIGTHIASTATILLFKRPQLRLYCVDTWHRSPERYEMALAHLNQAGVRPRATIIKEDSTEGAKQVADASLDFAFIDASKEPARYESDCRAWLPKVKAGGFLAGHDYHMAPVPPIAHRIADELGKELTISPQEAAPTWTIRL